MSQEVIWVAIGASAAVVAALLGINRTVAESRRKRKETELLVLRDAEDRATRTLATIRRRWEDSDVRDAIRFVRLTNINLQSPDYYSALMLGFSPGNKLQTVFRIWEDAGRQTDAPSLISRLPSELSSDCVECWKWLRPIVGIRRQVEPDFAVGFERLARACGYTE